MNRMLLLNIGNTHTQWAEADVNGNLTSTIEQLPTETWLKDLTTLPAAENDCTIWAACVVPQCRKLLEDSCYYRNINFIDTVNAAAAGLDFSQVDCSTLGADRIANAAALLDYPLPAACFDCGTAITMELVTAEKVFAGGAIMPGRKLMRKSLYAGTAALPDLPLSDNLPEAMGVNTLQAMALGIDRGAVGMVREMVTLAQEMNVKTLLVAGGDADFFCRGIEELTAAGKEFTLRGIAVIAAKQGFLE